MSKLQKDTTLRSETARHWLVLQEDRAPLHFNRERAEAEAVSNPPPPLPPSRPLLCALRRPPCARTTRKCIVISVTHAPKLSHISRCAQVKALTLEDCLATFDRCVARGAPERRTLLARVYGSQHRPLMEAETQRTISEAAAAAELVHSLEEWREQVRGGGRSLFDNLV
eukprot:COSAG01_NODE_9527_length_2418_cov_31.584304_4_plen_169_part_00